MAIEKNSFKVARFDTEIHSPHTRDTLMSSDEDEELQRPAAVDSDDDDEFDDCDSGAGSDDFDLLELGETGEEFCQAGDQTRSIPYELYDLHGLKDVLSMEVWNEVLTEEERFGLSKYLPDMDHENFVRTLKELFSGDNLHFGSPIDKLFEMMKGGLCEPRVALYRQGLIFLQRRKHYHNLRKHHNGMVNNLCQIRDAWMNCRGYSIDEKLRVLNIMKSQKSLMNENMEDFRSESSEREESKSGDALWEKKMNDRKSGKKTGRYSGYNVGPTPDISSHGRKTTVDSPANYGKRNPKGTLKLPGSIPTSMKDLAEPFSSTLHGVEMKSGRYGLGLPVPFYNNNNNELGYDSSTAAWMYGQVLEEDGEPEMKVDGPTGSKMKKRKGTRAEEDMDSFMVTPVSSARNNLNALGRKQAINKLSDIKVLTAKPSYARDMYDGGKKVKYTENLQQISADNQPKFGKGQKSNLSLSGIQRDTVDTNDPTWLSKQGRLFPTESISKPSGLYAKTNRGKMSREAVDLDANDVYLHNEYRANSSQDKFHASSLYLRRDGVGNRGDDSTHSRSEDTESDSSEHINEDKDDNPLMRSKWAYPAGVRDLKSVPDMKNAQLLKRDKKNSYLTIDGSSQFSQRMEDYGGNRDMMNSVQKGKMHDVGYSNISPPEELDKNYFPGVIGADDRQQFYQLGRNGHVEGKHGDSLQMPSLKPSPLITGKRKKGEVPYDFGLTQSNYMQNNNLEDDIYCTRPMVAHNGVSLKLGKKGQTVDLFSGHHPERSDVPLMGCDTLSKKRKVKNDLKTYMDPQDNKEYLHADAELQQGDDISYSRKRGKNKLVEDASDILENGVSQPHVMETETEEIEAEAKRQKKPFPLITPTVHSGFSFSIIHLLSSVRMAMITLLPEDSSESRKHLDKNDGEQGSKENKDSQQEDINPNTDANTSEPSAQVNVPSLTVQEIMNRVKSNPGDPCILETQEPLQDLVRGVLKIFSSRTAPLGAKGWKPLVIYQKPTKSWLWIGPAVSPNLSESEPVEEVTSPDSWGIPHKMLVKIVDSFANWLKNSQDTLQQIGSLPDPPLTLMQINLDEKERFKDLRAQKSLNTINSSSDEVKDYFRKEEVLRYLIPDRAFSYTAVDGKKSIVAPLRRCGGKPTSKARDHFMLKRDRPPHVTILCLVRDAASRLPGSIGTRADVCTLIRDSQYIVEDVSDTQVNQVVSGALDRLHYERDPCVQFDGERKLWVYLHRDREEEDFEDDGTSSTKKWRRQKKEVPEAGDVTVAYPGPPGDSGFDLVSDLNVEALCVDDDNGGNDHVEDNKLLCRENSTNEDFVEDGFGGEPPV